jgi:hypothetical protein
MIPLVEVGGQSLRDVNKSMELGSSGGANAHIVISTGINSVPTSDLKPAASSVIRWARRVWAAAQAAA